MEIYVCEGIHNAHSTKEYISFSDDLLHHFYTIRNSVSIDISLLYNIDPYKDTIFYHQQIKQLYSICTFILENNLCEDYQNKLAAEKRIYNLKNFCQKAIATNLNLVFIGD